MFFNKILVYWYSFFYILKAINLCKKSILQKIFIVCYSEECTNYVCCFLLIVLTCGCGYKHHIDRCFKKRIWTQDSAMACDVCCLLYLQSVGIYIFLNSEWHDLRLQHTHVPSMVVIHHCQCLRMGDCIFIVYRIVRLDQTWRFGAFTGKNNYFIILIALMIVYLWSCKY